MSTSIDVCQELHFNALEFANEANNQRAFPDARDGLKPGQRACLWEMYVKSYTPQKPHVKSAKISGGVAASFWPHGTSAIYETFARMSQPWINNIPEVDFHGSNGSIVIGPTPAADRYTEARLSKATFAGMMQTLKKNVVPMQLNFSEDEEWPEVLPAIFPRLFVNGSQGIGYTIANVWLPGNLNEFTNVVENYLTTSELDYSNLYPDFPSGGVIINKNEISKIWETGKGKAVLRGKVEIKDNKILITELPYQVYVEPFIDEIKDLINKEEINDIDEIINKSNQKQLLIEIVCGNSPAKVLTQLYNSTSLQKNFNANQFALVGKTPKLLTLKDYIDIYIKHNITCIKKEYENELNQAKARMEIVDGLIKALEDIDNVIEIIKKSESSSAAKDNLIKKYFLTEAQAKGIISMRLGTLAKLEKLELEQEKKELVKKIEDAKEFLVNQNRQNNEFLDRLKDFTNKFGYTRRTQLTNIDLSNKAERIIEEIPPEECVVVVSNSGNVKRIPSKNLKTQKRGGVGVKNNDDIIAFSMKTNTRDMLMVFTNKGKMYRILVDSIPSGTTATKGTPISSLIKFENNEIPIAYSCLYNGSTAKYVFFATKNGTIKKVELAEFLNIKKNTGVQAITLREGDSLAATTFIEDETLILVSKKGKIIKFNSNTFTSTGRKAIGIKGITLDEDDEVIACLPIKHNTDYLAIVSKNGDGRKLELSSLPIQSRGGKGTQISENIAGIALVDDSDSLLIIGNKSSICVKASELPVLKGKKAEGNSLIKNNKVVSISKF